MATNILETFQNDSFKAELLEETFIETGSLGAETIRELSLRFSNLQGTALRRWPHNPTDIRQTCRDLVINTFKRIQESDFNLAEIGIELS